MVAALGIQLVGGVLVPINTRYKGKEAGYILEKSRAVALFTVNGFLDTDYISLLQDAGVTLPKTTVILRGEPQPHTCSWAHFLEDAAPEDALNARMDRVSPDDLCDIMFTSGTTGQPKGAMCTHAQTLRAFYDWSHVVGLRAGDHYLVVAPFFHGFGYKAGWLAALMMNATIFPQAVFDVDAVLKRIGRDQITMLPGPPALYQTILNREDLDEFDISSLRLAVTGAASIPVSLIHQMRDILKFETVITGYGLTEATAIATMCRHDDAPETIAKTSGRAIPGVTVRIVSEDGQTLPPGEPGEVVISGYNVMKGYLDSPQATAETIQNGWLHTGDIGVMNAQGYIRITDRKKDMFIVGGFNAYPAEIDNLIRTHPAVLDVATIGVPDARLGEVGRAFVTKKDADLDEATLIAWCRENMANFKVPRSIRFVSTLPRNALGKVQKFVLRQMN